MEGRKIDIQDEKMPSAPYSIARISYNAMLIKGAAAKASILPWRKPASSKKPGAYRRTAETAKQRKK